MEAGNDLRFIAFEDYEIQELINELDNIILLHSGMLKFGKVHPKLLNLRGVLKEVMGEV